MALDSLLHTVRRPEVRASVVSVIAFCPPSPAASDGRPLSLSETQKVALRSLQDALRPYGVEAELEDICCRILEALATRPDLCCGLLTAHLLDR
jgi:hypothetical protein